MESAARFCGRHTQVPASSPPPCAESAARFCGRQTHVSASSPPPCADSAESAARFASGTGTCACPLRPSVRHHVRGALHVVLTAHACDSQPRHHVRRALRASAGCTRTCPPRLRHRSRRARRASAVGSRKCLPRLRTHVRRVLRSLPAPQNGTLMSPRRALRASASGTRM